MNRRLWRTATSSGMAVVVVAVGAVACGNSGSPSSNSSSYPTFNDAGGNPYEPVGDAASAYTDAAPEAGPPPTQAFVRLAAWSPDEAAVDFCVAPHGTATYQGPLVAQLIASNEAGLEDAEAGPAGLSFPEVSAYVALAPGQYDVTVVSAGSASCASGTLGATTLPPLVVGTYTTFAVVGDAQTAGGDRALSLTAFADDTGARAPSVGALLRFINASPGEPFVEFGSGSLQNANFEALFSRAPFAATATRSESDAGTIDAGGYLAYSPLTGAVLSTHASTGAASDLAIADGVYFGYATVTTIVLVGGKTGDATSPPQLLQCADGAVSGWLSACAPISP